MFFGSWDLDFKLFKLATQGSWKNFTVDTIVTWPWEISDENYNKNILMKTGLD